MHCVSIKAEHTVNVRSTIYYGHSWLSLQLNILECNSYILVTSHPGLVRPWEGFWNIKINCSTYLEKWHSGELEVVLPAFFFTTPFHMFGFCVCINYLLACCLNCCTVQSHSVWVFQYTCQGCCQPITLHLCHPSMITVPLLHMGPSYNAIHSKLIPIDFPWAAALPALSQHSSIPWGPPFRHSPTWVPTGGSSPSRPGPVQAPFHRVSAGTVGSSVAAWGDLLHTVPVGCGMFE